MKRVLLFILALAASASPAFAQTQPARRVQPAQDRIGINAFGAFDWLSIASSKTFDAVFGTSKATAAGAGADVVNVWKHVFLRVAATRVTLNGERVIVFNSTVYTLGNALSVQMTPVEVGGGWRFASRNANSRITPYVGAAAVFLNYKETSTFADSLENVNESIKGVGIFGGVDVTLTRRIFAGAEAQYRTINSSPATNSAAASFNEKDLGGTALRARVGIRF